MSPSQDTLSFEDLYKRYFRAVTSVFLRRGFSRDESRDLAQTTFFRVFRKWESYRGEAAWSYLLSTANRVGHNELRYRQAEKRDVETTPLNDHTDHQSALAEVAPMTGQPPPSALDQILSKERTRQMREVMAELTPEELRCLKMWIAGRQYHEIMNVEQVSMDTVKSRLYRTKKKLREKVQLKLGDEDLNLPQTRGNGK